MNDVESQIAEWRAYVGSAPGIDGRYVGFTVSDQCKAWTVDSCEFGAP